MISCVAHPTNHRRIVSSRDWRLILGFNNLLSLLMRRNSALGLWPLQSYRISCPPAPKRGRQNVGEDVIDDPWQYFRIVPSSKFFKGTYLYAYRIIYLSAEGLAGSFFFSCQIRLANRLANLVGLARFLEDTRRIPRPHTSLVQVGILLIHSNSYAMNFFSSLIPALQHCSTIQLCRRSPPPTIVNPILNAREKKIQHGLVC